MKWIVTYDRKQKAFNGTVALEVRRAAWAEHESVTVWYDKAGSVCCTECSGPLTAMLSNCPHANAARRAINGNRVPGLKAPAKEPTRTAKRMPAPVKRRTESELLDNMQASLKKIDELLTDLAKDDRFKIHDPKGDRLHSAIGAICNVGSGIHLLRKRIKERDGG